MKILLLALIGILCTCVAGYDKRGAFEKVAYYYAYLAEGAYESDSANWLVAPGCRGKDAGASPGSSAANWRTDRKAVQRCQADDLFRYIWRSGPDRSDSTAPTQDFKWSADVKSGECGVKDLAMAVYKVVIPGTKNNLCGDIDASKLLPTKFDMDGRSHKLLSKEYYEALEGTGLTICRLRRALQAKKPIQSTLDAKSIANYGIAALQAVVDLRQMDLDTHRKDTLNRLYPSKQYFNLRLSVVTRPSKPANMYGNFIRSWQTFNKDMTLIEFKKKMASRGDREVEQIFNKGLKVYEEDQGTVNHAKALQAAQTALKNAKCLF